jgi:hypothetical protein
MKLTDALSNINLALNYPALAYTDIKLYFDMAIAELNTTLHTSIPMVSEMITIFRRKLSKTTENSLVLTEDPRNNNFEIIVDPLYFKDGTPKYFYNSESKVFYAWNPYTKSYAPHESLVGIYVRQGTPEKYVSVVYNTAVYWAIQDTDTVDDCDLEDFLPNDWVLLWLIPYVCFKYSVRDGGSAQTFAEEMQQGFQQLQETYDVPSRVSLATYADKLAYRELVEDNIPNLNIKVPTKAIYESMKHPRESQAIYGNMFDRGGFMYD